MYFFISNTPNYMQYSHRITGEKTGHKHKALVRKGETSFHIKTSSIISLLFHRLTFRLEYSNHPYFINQDFSSRQHILFSDAAKHFLHFYVKLLDLRKPRDLTIYCYKQSRHQWWCYVENVLVFQVVGVQKQVVDSTMQKFLCIVSLFNDSVIGNCRLISEQLITSLGHTALFQAIQHRRSCEQGRIAPYRGFIPSPFPSTLIIVSQSQCFML